MTKVKTDETGDKATDSGSTSLVDTTINNGPTAEEIEAKEAEAKAQADADAKAKAEEQAKIDAEAEAEAKRLEDAKALEAAKQAEVEAELDMSLDARFQRGKDAMEDAIDCQNQINRVVNQRTKELDDLILEKEKANPTNSISEIQFYLTGSMRKREESASRRRRMLESVLDPAEIIRQLDPRSPIDRRPPVRKAPHGSVQHPGTKPQKKV